jgi:hypothetical protein
MVRGFLEDVDLPEGFVPEVSRYIVIRAKSVSEPKGSRKLLTK